MKETNKRLMLVIGSRGSRLALTQTKLIQAEIGRVAPEVETRIEIIKTSADKDVVTSLRATGGAGVFVKELEQALSRGEIDLAVHSMKDVPTAIADGLRIAAVPEREDARDALIIKQNIQDGAISGKTAPLSELPAGARVGTGSFRRQAQLLALRPDLRILDIRGNVDTRIRKMRDGEYDAVALALAGLRRLGLQDQILYTFPYDEMLPAPGQGALAIEVRADDALTNEVVEKLNHPHTALEVAAERDFLERLGGGCNVPIAVYARVKQGLLEMDAVAASPDGRRVVRDKASGDPAKRADICAALAERILIAGGREILYEFRR
ncbi:MAG: hydroxymethylbilane synthase [Acidobacteriota bacterium]|jgi:hydroxymethylbilane synthase|nr:hydroxymethylbilane synthase [Acidobacteriota bacterium]